MPVGKRRKGKQATRGVSEQPPPPHHVAAAAETAVPIPPVHPAAPPSIENESPNKEPPLVLTSDKRRGIYECDYCHSDISQVPRIRCAVCPDFDLCLDCFGTADHAAAIARIKAVHDATKGVVTNHEHTHGYRVADSTRYQLFPSTRTVMPSRPASCVDDGEEEGNDEDDMAKQDDGAEENEVEKDKTDSSEVQDVVMEDVAVEKDAQDSAVGVAKEVTDETTETPTTAAPEKVDGDGEADKEEQSILVIQEDPKCTWTAEEDLRLLDAIATCGLGNWADIAETISGNGSNNKTPKRCMERYLDDFLGRYGEILPPYTIVDCDDEEAAVSEDDGKGESDGDDDGSRASKRRRLERTLMRSYSAISLVSQATGRKKKRVVPTCALPGYEEAWPNPYLPPLPGVQLGQEVGRDSSARAEQAYVKAQSQVTSQEEADKLRKEWEETRLNQVDGPTALPIRPEDLESLPGSELAGYMPRRGDFDMEWENDAEAVLADMEFSPNDLPQDRQLKIQVIEIYNSKLDERERRKQFLLSRGLVDYRKIQKADEELPRDERALVRRMRLFERLHTPEEHKEFISGILKAKRLRKEIAKLQMYRRMGIRSLAEAEKFELDKDRREFHKQAQRQKEAEKAAAAAAAATGVAAAAVVEGRSVHGATDTSSLWKQYKTTRVRRSAIRTSDSVADTENDPAAAKEVVVIDDGEPSVAKAADMNDVSQTPATAEEPKTKPDGSSEQQAPVEAATPSNETPPPIGTKDTSSDKGNSESSIVHSPGYDLLFSKEVALCEKLDISPAQYLEVKSSIIQESFKRGLLDKNGSSSNRRTIVKIDAKKRGDVVDFMVRAGWVSSTLRGAGARPNTVSSTSVSS